MRSFSIYKIFWRIHLGTILLFITHANGQTSKLDMNMTITQPNHTYDALSSKSELYDL